MSKVRINPLVVSATLFTALVATLTIGVLGLLMNAVVEPQSLFDQMLSNNSSLICIAISFAIAGLLFKKRVLQFIGSGVIIAAALQSLLVTTNLYKILFMPWLAELEAAIYPAMILLFIVLGIMLALNPRHPIQRIWLRVTAALVTLSAIAMLAAHINPNGFMWLGPHPDITSVAAVLILILGVGYSLLAQQDNPVAVLPSKQAMLIGFIAVFLTSSVWYLMGYSSLKNIQAQAETEVTRLASARATMAMVNVQLMERMTERWEVAAENEFDFDRRADVRAYLRDIPHLLSLSALDGNKGTIWQEHRADSKIASLQVLADPEVQQWLEQHHIDTHFIIPELNFVHTDLSAVALMILPIADVIDDVRYLIAVFDLDTMLNPATRLTNDQIKVYTRLSQHAERSFETNKPSHQNELILASSELQISHGPKLELTATLYDFSELSWAANMRTAIVALGLLFSLAFVLMFEQNKALRHHSQRIALSQRKIRKQRQELSINEQRYKSLFSHHPDPVFSLDCDGRFTHVNDAFCQQLEVTRENVLNMHFNAFLSDDQFARVQPIFEQVINKLSSQRYDAVVTTHTSHTPKVFDITNLPIVIDGNVIGTFGIGKDITRVQQQAEQLAYQANHDGLTGLFNRAAFERELSAMLTQQRQLKDDNLLAVLFIDLDGFKPVNDSLGLKVGDAILQHVAARLQGSIKEPNLLARFSGDEFVMAATHLTSQEQVEGFVQHIMTCIDEPYTVGEHKIYLTASIGVTLSKRTVKNALSLIQQADIAMSQAKQQGRNHYQFYTEQRKSMSQSDILLRSQLQQAIDAESLKLYYQPIVDLSNDKIVAVEALMRWTLEDGTAISPVEFIPLAEATGQIIPAGRWALKQACKDIHELHNLGIERVAVNLSALQFHRANFFEQVESILAESGTSTDMIELELTESILMENTSNAITVLERMREIGISVSIDDFGTGFSGLSYLKTLPVRKLKIDRAFIKELSDSTSDRVITQGIINMARQVGLEVVAEGVETPEQLTLLKDFGCGFGQGFYFARPMPLTDLIQFLKSRV
ncbi:EAL domain-containing protein [Pseudidiomarina sp.]|uniref:EAL domain-containing protein n=1 Tax=Pseudidiomarina sp. TaxID=2081707 RepID=UPI003A9803B8